MSKSPAEPTLDGFLTLFDFDKKRDLEQYCRGLVISGDAFSKLVVSCEATGVPFLHKIFWKDTVPKHLHPSDSELKALAANGIGTIKSPEALKALRKMSQLFVERKYLVGHIFYMPDLTRWHFFCFDQRDLEEDKPNHWKEGAHVHFTNWLWPRRDAESVWSKFVTEGVRPADAVHVRFHFSRNLSKPK